MNGLLNGLVEYWQPDVSLGSLKGMVAGIDWSVPVGLSVVNDASFPSGKAIKTFELHLPNIVTPTNSILQGWGASDFLVMAWFKLNSAFSNYQFVMGEANTDGFDFGVDTHFPPTNAAFEIPGADGNYNAFIKSTGDPLTPDAAHCMMCWWTANDLTAHLQADGGTEFTQVQIGSAGAGTPDPSNIGAITMQGSLDGSLATTGGDVAMWRGNDAVANVLTQRALLFGGLGFVGFDAGNGIVPQTCMMGRQGGRGRRF